MFSDIDCAEIDLSGETNCFSVYCSRLAMAEYQVSFVMSIPYFIVAVWCPLTGVLVDKMGMRAVHMTLAPMVTLLAQLMLAMTSMPAMGALIGQGFAYAVFAAVIWPSIPLVVDRAVTGLAFGVVTSLQNVSCTILPMIIAAIYVKSGGKYVPNVCLLFVCCAAVGAILGISIWYLDIKNGKGVLNRGIWCRKDIWWFSGFHTVQRICCGNTDIYDMIAQSESAHDAIELSSSGTVKQLIAAPPAK